MLFISRDIDASHWAIVDSETGAEQVASRAQIEALIAKTDIEIAGVDITVGKSGHRWVGNIRPWQDPTKYTGKQAKMRTLLGVDVRTYNREITYIGVDCNLVRKSLKLRLSEFGSKVNWDIRIHSSNIDAHSNLTVTLVFDDNIDIIGKSRTYFPTNMLIDISELTSTYLVDTFYMELLESGRFMGDDWGNHIVDMPWRDLYYRQIGMLYTGVHLEERWLEELKKYPDMYGKHQFSEKELEAFKSITETSQITTVTLEEAARKDICAFLRGRTVFEFSLNDFDLLKSEIISVFDCISPKYRDKESYAFEKRMLLMFRNYVNFFEPELAVKKMYITLCNRVIAYIRTVCGKRYNASWNPPKGGRNCAICQPQSGS